ncbi:MULTISPECIES: ABC transporter substrate-binding protein [unclassified Beijerinckia]|uniref:ABC transporter substrate-binding protein n=1 Tax=unclassified Beijerinckia TaxID=2638183 RepID=UPI00089B0C05|nr:MULTISPECIES: ABC transporter substrate-binding protein [unclassified Beijerinckia]MDH7795974.1 ABC-type nitrate/sulfonate/bicarbonate transport system substrate-binding protein [Beijerinckia sp. GAS462]SEC24513.1 ABC-type nitrate/sulfonate/bicarbonate transport system, substrate-binding protein [Beijerinckia sp. 28-YEA-48]
MTIGFAACRRAAITAVFIGPLLHAPMALAETLKIGISALDDISHVNLQAAIAAGTFKKRGLDVELTVFKGGSPAQEALAAGEVGIVSASPPGVVAALNRGAGQICVGAIRHNASAWYLLTSAASPVTKLEDLAGKKIAIVAKGGTTDFYANWAIQKVGIKADFIPLGTQPTMAAALKSGQVEAAVMFNAFANNLITSGQARVLIDYGKELPKHMPACYASNQAFIKTGGPTLEKFWGGWIEAARKFHADKAWAMDFLKSFYKESDPKVLDFMYETSLRYTEGDPRTDAAEMEATIKMAGVELKKPMAELFTNAFIPEMK